MLSENIYIEAIFPKFSAGFNSSLKFGINSIRFISGINALTIVLYLALACICAIIFKKMNETLQSFILICSPTIFTSLIMKLFIIIVFILRKTPSHEKFTIQSVTLMETVFLLLFIICIIAFWLFSFKAQPSFYKYLLGFIILSIDLHYCDNTLRKFFFDINPQLISNEAVSDIISMFYAYALLIYSIHYLVISTFVFIKSILIP